MRRVVLFGGPGIDPPGGVQLIHRRQRETIELAVAKGVVDALLIDARTPADSFAGLALLRALYDNPRRPQRPLHPRRVLALIPPGDVEAAFAFGRYGIAGVIDERALPALAARLKRLLDSEPAPQPLAFPEALAAPARAALVTPRGADELPTVAIGYRHAPETLDALARYCRTLRAHAGDSSVFADVATLIEVMVDEGLTVQTNLAAKAGTTHSGQFIGSFAFYRELRRTRYARIPEPPDGAIAMEVFIAVDEVLHEVLHLLYLANQLRAGIPARHCRLAEEISLGWWQGVVHNRVFSNWICDRHILEINNDFVLCEDKQHSWAFWEIGAVFDQYAHHPWMPYVIAQLPARPSYIGVRPDLAALRRDLQRRPEAAFVLQRFAELAIDVPFDDYPPVPDGLRVDSDP